jgi:RNA polymerase sigma factor (sigma-70 family)
MTAEDYNNIVDTCADNIYRFILKNIKNENKAEDIVQDSYEKLWIKHEEVAFEKAKAYLFSTAYHTMIDYIRKEKRISYLEEYNPNQKIESSSYSDLKEILNEAVNKLPDIQRSVILLRDYEGYSYEEISQITGLNENQVKVYIYRARIYLKNYIRSVEVLI